MINLNDFKGDYFVAPYEIQNFPYLRDSIVEEILFYGSGYGWASSASKIRKANSDIVSPPFIKVAMLFPYVNQKANETQDAYLKTLMIDVRKELRRQIITGGIGGDSYHAIDNFEYGVTRIHKDIHHFALLMRK